METEFAGWDAYGDPVYVYPGEEPFITDDGIIPTCDLCGGPQMVYGDWNGETGNHVACEERVVRETKWPYGAGI